MREYLAEMQQNSWEQQLQDITNQFLNQNNSYGGSYWDTQDDPLTQAYIDFDYENFLKSDQYSSLADRYGREGQMTMQDVLGQISSRTGGLASSYAATAAQQQYNDYIAQLESVARGQFADEKELLLKNAQLAQTMSDRDYQRYLDELSANRQGQSAALDALYQLLGYQQQQDAFDQQRDDVDYDRNQAGRAEAQNRIYDYLVNQGGSVGGLDADLITLSGYTTAELNAMEARYRQAAAAAAASQSSGGGSRGGGGGSGSSGGGGGSSGGTSGGGTQDYNGLFVEAQASGYPEVFIENNYKQYGFTSKNGLADAFDTWQSRGEKLEAELDAIYQRTIANGDAERALRLVTEKLGGLVEDGLSAEEAQRLADKYGIQLAFS